MIYHILYPYLPVRAMYSLIFLSTYSTLQPAVFIIKQHVIYNNDLPCYRQFQWEYQYDANIIFIMLTHWGRVTHICISKLTIIDSDNGLLPGRHQAIIWTNAGILLIGPLGTNFNEILIAIYIFSFEKMHLKMSSGNWQPFCLGLKVLTDRP